MLKNISISILLLVYSLSLSAQNFSSKQIDSLVDKSFKMMPQAGLAIALVKDGKIAHLKGYGYKSMDTKEEVDENTLFGIASNSKAFTSMTLGILVDRGEISWNDKVLKYIPEFTMYNKYVRDNFTIADLLTHRSGLGLGAGDLMFFPDGSDFGIDDVIKSFQYQTPTSDFRTKYDYDNLLYLVAGEVVKRVSGKEWVDFVKEEIFDKLEMTNTVASLNLISDNNNNNIAKPHSFIEGNLKEIAFYSKPNNSLASAGGICASVSDLSKWILVHLNDGNYGDSLKQKLISKNVHEQMWTPYTNISYTAKAKAPYYNHYTAYGLGWFIKDHNSFTVISHTGGLPGFLSQTVMIPELNIGFVILTNSDPGGYSFMTIANTLIDAFTEVDGGRDWLLAAKNAIDRNSSKDDEISKEVWAQVESSKTIKYDRKSFIGLYEDPWFGKMEVYKEGKELWIKSYRSPKLTGQMFYYKQNVFAVKWNYQDMPCDVFATFEMGTKGKSEGIKMKAISPKTDFSFDFHDLNLKRIK